MRRAQPYRGPNDVCLDLAGNIYFTDPTDSSKENPIGAVYRIAMKPDNSVDKVTRIAEGLAFPNGLAVSPDQKKFYVAESETNRLIGWDLKPDGTLDNRRVVIEFPNVDARWHHVRRVRAALDRPLDEQDGGRGGRREGRRC